MNRRVFCRDLLLTGSAALIAPGRLLAAAPRELAFYHTHTGERLTARYHDGGDYLPAALAEINYLLRDFRTDEVFPVDHGVLDILHELCATTGCNGTFEVISGYRSSQTNEMLRHQGGGGVAKRSLHMEGKAIDVRLRGVRTARLRDAAISLKRGGVGYYAASDFIHVDTGRVRRW